MYGGTKAEMERLLADAEKISGVHYEMGNFADLINAIHVVQTEMGITGTTANEASTTIQGSVSAAGAAWQNLITGIGDENANLDVLIGNFVSSADTAAENIIPRITQILSGMGEAVQQISPILAEQIPALISDVLPDMVDAGAQLLVGLITGIITALPDLVAAVPEIISSIVDSLQENWPAISEAGGKLLDMLKTGILEYIPELLERLPDVIINILNFFAENTPKFIESGVDFLMKLAEGIIGAIPSLVDKLPQVITAFLNFYSEYLPAILRKGSELLIELANGIMEAIPDLVAKLPEIIDAIVNGIADLSQAIIDAGSDIVEGLWQGISHMAGWIGEKIQGFGEGVLQDLKDFFGIKSPSRVMRDEVGKMIGAGLAEGIEDSTKPAVKSANALSRDVEEALRSRSYDLSQQLKSAVDLESARMTAKLTVASNAPAEARAARARTSAAQIASANAAYTNHSDSGVFVLNIDGKEFYRGTLDSLRTVEDETPRTLDDK